MCLDFRSDGKLAKFLSSKVTAITAALTQMTVWVASILMLAETPEAVRLQLQSSPTGAAMLVLAGITFSFLLLLGIAKNVRIYIQMFLVFNLVVIVVFVVGIFCTIVVNPPGFKVPRLLINIVHTFLDFLIYLIIRNYYLVISSPPDEAQNLTPAP